MNRFLISSFLLCSTLFAVWKPVLAAAPGIVEEVEVQFDLRCVLKRDEKRNEVQSAAGAASPMLLLGYTENSQAPYLILVFAPDEMRLVRAQGNARQILARAKTHYQLPSAEGTKLVVQWREGKLAVLYNNRVLLRQENLGTLEGAVALRPSAEFVFADTQFQPIEPLYFADDFMRMGNQEVKEWEGVQGQWKVQSAANPARVANAFTYSGQAEPNKPALALAGRWFWSDYTLSTAVRPMQSGEVGLVTYYQDPNNYLLFKWLGGVGQGRWRGKEKQLWRVWQGQPMIIASAPGGYRANQWYRLDASMENGVFKAAIDEQIVLQKQVDLFGQGRAGLYENGGAALFDDVFAWSHDNRTAADAIRKTSITPQFTKEESMSNWAGVKAQWQGGEKGGLYTFWNRGVFWGDHQIKAKVAGLAVNNGQARLVLNGDGASFDSGYALELTRPDGRKWKAALLREGKLQKEITLEKDVGEHEALLERRGNQITAMVGETEIKWQDAKPLTGRAAGFSTQNARIEPQNAIVEGRQVYDYTFYRAPTDWVATRGEWDISSRWLCTKDWAWYGGRSDNLAALWNKRQFAGDYTIDVFAACQMDNPAPPHYNHPRDLNITLAGDGDDPSSGYSFIFGGWNNSFTRILRGDKVVAETKETLLPANYQAVAHHKWFHLRVEKKGNTFSYFIDNKLALSYSDPKPLTGKHIALWTAGNGMMIARATLYYEKEIGLQSVLPPLRDAAFAPASPVEKLPWKVRGDNKGVRLDAVALPDESKQNLAVRAMTLSGGGEFAVAAQIEPFDVFKTPRLSFDVRVTPRTEVNLYIKARDTLHAVRLSGASAENERDGVKSIGKAAVAADEKWHRVNLDLSALLKAIYPDASELKVDEIFLGNLTRDWYRQLGFGINAPGSEYQVRGFSLRSPDNRIAQLLVPELKKAEPTPPMRVVETPAAVVAPVVPPVVAPARGLMQLRATFCQDNDGGPFQNAMLNQPIEWQAFTRPIFTSVVKSIDFIWPEQKSPGFGIRPTYWSARFYGKVQVATEGDYIFSLDRLDDGGRLSIDGKTVLEAWKIQEPKTHDSQIVHLTPGLHDIRLDYCQGPGPGGLALSWKGPDFAKEIVPVIVAKQP
ncbi:MAG TPA: PA14 domain-containing protein [Abditibacteriaceae bacterium]